jgi:hypothetical protein
MAGLESIALAVAQLERASAREDTVSRGAVSPQDDAIEGPSHLSSFESQPPTLPSRSAFMPASRIVSTDFSQFASPHGFTFHAPVLPTPQPQNSASEGGRTPDASSPTELSESSLAVAQSAMDNLMSVMGLAERSTSSLIKSPTDPIEKVLLNDVLLGRGGETNHHSGNVFYRHLVKACQPAYISAKRRNKPRIAESIVYTVRQLGGRFIKKGTGDNVWVDVGNTKAREKTSQALREGAPDLRNGSPIKGAEEKTEEGCGPGLVLVETAQPELNSPTKKRRTSLDALARAAASTTPGMDNNCDLLLMTRSPDSSMNITASVSGDEESSKQSKRSNSSLGPRIKLLKRRLENDNGL